MDRYPYEQIVSAVIKILFGHKNGFRGHPAQEPYKGELFEQFVIAFNEGFLNPASGKSGYYLSGDALTKAIASRNPEVFDDKTALDAWQRYHTSWDEWDYAWRRAHQMKRQPGSPT